MTMIKMVKAIAKQMLAIQPGSSLRDELISFSALFATFISCAAYVHNAPALLQLILHSHRWAACQISSDSWLKYLVAEMVQ